jgi:hypothetical protein
MNDTEENHKMKNINKQVPKVKNIRRKTCPFCGYNGGNQYGIKTETADSGGNLYAYIECDKCYTQGPRVYCQGLFSAKEQEVVIKRWNERKRKFTPSKRIQSNKQKKEK